MRKFGRARAIATLDQTGGRESRAKELTVDPM